MRKMSKTGFTLIELLIVVLIIAILAAIAVPNFLEFQVRAKVSRVMSDQRALATAFEAYMVDNDAYPVDLRGCYNICSNCLGMGDWDDCYDYTWPLITTPIAYITQQPFDVFTDGGSKNPVLGTYYPKGWPYWYENFTHDIAGYDAAEELSYAWALASIGPSNERAFGLYGVVTGLYDTPAYRTAGYICDAYDPTNGTVSRGQIIRTSKGEYKTPGN